jgi:ABC-type Fe3+-hydroxamate transport system substrate-binding protein
MKRPLLIFSIGFILVACTSVEDRQASVQQFIGDTLQIGSGSVRDVTGQVTDVGQQVTDTVTMGTEIIEGIKATIADLHARMLSVQKGLKKFQEAKELIEEGVGGGLGN